MARRVSYERTKVIPLGILLAEHTKFLEYISLSGVKTIVRDMHSVIFVPSKIDYFSYYHYFCIKFLFMEIIGRKEEQRILIQAINRNL